MFEEFSAGYYVGQLYIKPYAGDHAVMARSQHVEANEQVYATGETIDQLNHPLVMKVDQHHVPVFAAEDISTDMLGLPDDVLEAIRVGHPPTLKEVLVAKAERAAQLLRWTTPYTVREPDFR